jgi:Uma2 family endonuclease
MESPQTRWTAAMVRALPDDGFRHEVIDGEHVVTPAPSWTHQTAVLQLARRLADYLDRTPVGHLVIAPADVEFDEHNLVELDLFVVPLVAGKKPRAWEDVRTLLLAVEVLSPLTMRAGTACRSVTSTSERASRSIGSSTSTCESSSDGGRTKTPGRS